MVKVSVVIPCYNCEEFIKNAVKSVYSQDHKNWELILVNNNSTDNTLKVLIQIQKADPQRVKVINEEKKGANAARNRGFWEAEGQWIQFLDADDELCEHKISGQLGIIASAKEEIAVVVGTYTFIQYLNPRFQLAKKLFYTFVSREIEFSEGTIKMQKKPFKEDKWVALASSKLGITSSNLWKKDCLVSVNGWDEDISSSQEYNLLFKLLKAGVKLGYDFNPRTIVYRRLESISLSEDKSRVERIILNWWNLRQQIIAYLKSNDLFTDRRRIKFDEALYIYLMNNRYKHRQLIDKLLEERIYEVPFKLKIKIKVKNTITQWFQKPK